MVTSLGIASRKSTLAIPEVAQLEQAIVLEDFDQIRFLSTGGLLSIA